MVVVVVEVKILSQKVVTSPAYLAEGESDVWKLLLESFIHVLLEVKRFDVFDDRRLEQKTSVSVKTAALSSRDG